MHSIKLFVLLGLAVPSNAQWADSAPKPKGKPVSELMPFYKTGNEIHQALHELAETCSGADAELTIQSGSRDVNLDVFKVSRSSGGPKTKAMLVFGEHARELVSPESALSFARTLCGQGANSAHADAILNDVEFVLVPNANPVARKQVEEGSYCKRTNEDGVDLNRNWGDSHRDESLAGSGDETDPGPRGFSEPESQALKDLVTEVHPDIYLSVHSGAYLLGAPYGYTKSKKPKDDPAMEEVLGPISEKYCNGMCPYGGLMNMINYPNGGCDIDYVYETVGTPYVFTWEIYTGPRFRGEYIDKAQTMQEERKAPGNSFLQRHRSKLAMLEPENDQDAQDCIDQFLPKTKEELDSVTENWSDAYLTLSEEVVNKVKQSKQGAPTTPSPAASADDKLKSNLDLGLYDW